MEQTTQLPDDLTAKWSLGKKIAFRFFFIFMVVYSGPQFLEILVSDYIPAISGHNGDTIVLWVGKHILHIGGEIATEQNGSGDTTYEYIFLFTSLISAFAGCLTWSLVDRKRNNYFILNNWFIVYLRYFLAAMLLTYGFIKFSQFPAPMLTKLMQPLGMTSPMGLLWTFMGYSHGYTLFSAMLEISAGVLLLTRRTAILGALLSVGVMANVFALNICYDVPVKLFSALLIFTALIILSGHATKLLDFFVLGKQPRPFAYPLYFSKRWMNNGRWIVKILFVGLLLYSAYTEQAEDASPSGHPPLYGFYYVQSFVSDGDTLQPCTTDNIRWKTFIVDDTYTSVQLMNGRSVYYTSKTDTATKIFTFSQVADTTKKWPFHYEQPDSNHLLLSGLLKGDSIDVKLLWSDYRKMPLMAGKFHWINERPNNY